MSLLNRSEQTQKGHHNIQAGGDVKIYNGDDNISFDLQETEQLIMDIYEISQKMEVAQVEFTYVRMEKIEDKNKLNDMEEYFQSRIQKDIVYFDEIKQILQLNEDDFRDRFEYIIGTIKGAILAIDDSEKLTPLKINLIFSKFYKTDWDWQKKQKAERLIHFMYFYCFLGKKL